MNSNNFMQQHSADHALFEWVEREAVDIFPTLSRGRTYPLRTLCGEDLWLQMDRRQRGMAAKFLEHLITFEHFALSIADAEYGNPNLYQLK